MIVPRFTFFTKNFVIRCNQVTKMFRSGRLQADITIWVLRKVRVDTVLTRSWFHFCLRLHWKVMRWLGSVLASLLCFPQGFVEVLSSTKFALNFCGQSSNSRDTSLCTSSRSLLLFLFSVSVNSCSGSPRSPSLVFPLLSGTGFSVYRLTSSTESCDEDDGEVGESVVEEELADKPGKINGT